MTRDTASIFIGSSSEARYIAEALQEILSRKFEAVVWDKDVFRVGEGQFDSLIRASREFDFAVFVAASDDTAVSRGLERSVPRDNVILEIGLFIGALGKDRVFIVSPDGDIGLPSDLNGITTARFVLHQRDRIVSAVASPCRQIQQRIEQIGRLSRPVDQSVYVAAVCYKIDDDGLQVRLIRTSRGRWGFPKGRALPGEALALTAVRCAEDEAGISGRPEILETFEFRHLKESQGLEQNVVAHVLRQIREFNVDEVFRSPEWMSFDEAETAVMINRPGKYSRQLREVLRWAKTIISNSDTTIRRVAGVVPIRLGKDNSPEILLVTSKQSQSWVIPKGAPVGAESFAQAALREAREEAGISGTIVGAAREYEFQRLSLRHVVQAFPLLVTVELEVWDEDQVRERRWFSVEEAIKIVHEVSLRGIIKQSVTDLAGYSF